MNPPDEPDRKAILARRKHFIARTLEGVGDAPLAGSRTKLMALAVSGLATACPCLDIYVPPEETSDSDSGETAESETGESGATEESGETEESGAGT